MVALIDVLICGTSLPVAISYLTDRSSALFGAAWFCGAWGFLWEVVPYLSVYLVALMAVSRVVSLILPLKVLNTRAMLISTGLYTCFCVASKIPPLLLTNHNLWNSGSSPFGYWDFHKDILYCYLRPTGAYWEISAVQGAVQIGTPAPIVIVCCSICCLVIHRLKTKCKKLNYCNRKSRRTTPTVTILILCGVYTLCNIPVFVNYVLYSVTWLVYKRYTALYNNSFMYWYSWNLTYVVCVCVNSTANPSVLLARCGPFRDWCKKRVKVMATESVELFHTFKTLI